MAVLRSSAWVRAAGLAVVVGLILCGLIRPVVADGPPPAVAGTPEEVSDFSLLDYQGKVHTLRRSGAKAVVLFFTGANCPIGRQVAPRLEQIRKQYAGRGVAVWMVNATPANDPTPARLDAMYAMGRFAPRKALGDRYSIGGMRDLVATDAIGDADTLRAETREFVWGVPPLPPVVIDRDQLVTRYLHVNRTCEAIAIDVEARSVFYRGAVDDQWVEGAGKAKAKVHYLADALDQHLAGKPVAVPKTVAHGCAITFEQPKSPDGTTTYTRDVAPILAANCVSCHSAGNVGPFAMDSYESVKGWAAMTREVLLTRRMPPWHADPAHGHFANDRSLSTADAQALMRWVDAGAPRGDGPDPLAKPTTRPTAEPTPWALGPPDQIVRVPTQDVPATGTVEYRYVDSDFVMPRDTWLRAAITHVGNKAVTHHVIVRVRYPASYAGDRGEAYLFTTWVPGLAEGETPAGTGLFVPKGSRFNFELHYTTNGTPTTDDTAVGLYEAKTPPPMRMEVRACDTRLIDIPAGNPDARHAASYCFKRDAVLYGCSPHMHVRGSWMRFTLLYPDGRRQTVLSVPNYDFNWQTSYRLAEPIRVPAGAWMLCTGGFDNSPANPANPDPGQDVHWGVQSWQEMFMGFMDVADVPMPPATRPAVSRR